MEIQQHDLHMMPGLGFSKAEIWGDAIFLTSRRHYCYELVKKLFGFDEIGAKICCEYIRYFRPEIYGCSRAVCKLE